MKATDYIVKTLISEGISDVFGYPGGSVTNLMESFRRHADKIVAHTCYHEQAAAFAACGYAQVSGRFGVAYATAGPGATNLITGICHAWFDSIPVLFLTGQVNTFEDKGTLPIRQRGFQETDIVSMISSVTKYAVHLHSATELPNALSVAIKKAQEGRPGPVLIDLPMDVQREDITNENSPKHIVDELDVLEQNKEYINAKRTVETLLASSERPGLLLGAGVKICNCQEFICYQAERLGLPIVTSMIAVDIAADSSNMFGFIGAYGQRTANFIVAKSDLIIAIGSRMDIRQVGVDREKFAPQAKLVRFDIDEGELVYPVHTTEYGFCFGADVATQILSECKKTKTKDWLDVCREIKLRLADMDATLENKWIKKLGQAVKKSEVVTTDVGQNQVWVAQSFPIKNQYLLFSGGHGAMGVSLPSAIGACYAKPGKIVICFCGDGGLQMNIQELQYIIREDLPIKIVVLNNHSLGMIRHFQEMYFDSQYYQTKEEGGYSVPDFAKIASAYGLRSRTLHDVREITNFENELADLHPVLWQINLSDNTYIQPKLRFGSENQDQEPLIDRNLYKELMEL